MSSLYPYRWLSREDLVQMLVEQQRQFAPLQGELEQLKRASQRQAKQKRPGRKRGQGSFGYRAAPVPAELTEAPVTPTNSPVCGGRLIEDGRRFAYRTEIPTLPRSQLTQYCIRLCRRPECGQPVRGEHPDVAPDHNGANAHRLGERARAQALHYGVGVPVRKVPVILEMLTGIQVTQSALAHDAQRRAGGSVGQVYQQLRTRLLLAPAVHTDATGWRAAPTHHVRDRGRTNPANQRALEKLGGIGMGPIRCAFGTIRLVSPRTTAPSGRCGPR